MTPTNSLPFDCAEERGEFVVWHRPGHRGASGNWQLVSTHETHAAAMDVMFGDRRGGDWYLAIGRHHPNTQESEP